MPPQHPGGEFLPHPEEIPEPPEQGGQRTSWWSRLTPPERLAVGSIPAVWTAAEVMNGIGTSWYYPTAGTSLIAACAASTCAVQAWKRRRRPDLHPDPGFGAFEAAAAITATGAWVTAAVQYGPLSGRWDLLSLIYLAGSAVGYRWVRRHRSVLARLQREADEAARIARKADWHRVAPALGLHRSHLLQSWDTLLGEHYLIDTIGTGRLSSDLDCARIAELYAQHEGLPARRVDAFINKAEPAGRNLHIVVRREDPWARPFMHPATHPDAPFGELVPDGTTCTRPLVIGVDPETGRPLRLTVWDAAEGGKVIMVVASKGSGKTVVLNCITERLTACTDAVVIQVNLSKHREDSAWAPACALSALGRNRVAHARRALQWVLNEIEDRSDTGELSKIIPSVATPLIVVKIDEVDKVRRDPVCADLIDQIASKCRSEAVCLIVASQRATADMVGADVRALAETAVIGRFRRPSEADKATDDLPVPDMSEYGENKQGVCVVVDLGAGGSHERGRTFLLEDPREIARLAKARAKRRRAVIQRSQDQDRLWAEAAGTAAPTLRWEDESFAAAAGGGGATRSAPARGSTRRGGGGPDGPADADAGVADTRRRLAAIHDDDAGLDDDEEELPPEAEAALADLNAREREVFLSELTDVDIDPDKAIVLLQLLARPEGVSTREAARLLFGSDEPRMTLYRWLQRWAEEGLAEVRGKGGGRRFYATGKGREALARAAGGDDS